MRAAGLGQVTARETDVGIIAEGVETAAEPLSLQSLGMKRAQGYYLARPKPLADLPWSDAAARPDGSLAGTTQAYSLTENRGASCSTISP